MSQENEDKKLKEKSGKSLKNDTKGQRSGPWSRKEKEFIAELVHLIRENITPADFINISNPSLIVICINDATAAKAQTAMMKVYDKIEEMVFNNFNKFELVMQYKVVPLSTSVPFEKQLLDLTKQLTEQHD